MRSLQSYAVVAFCALLVSEAWAAKTVNGLNFQPSPPPAKECMYQPFHVSHERDAFFQELKQTKSKGTLQYRKGRDIVVRYPDFTTVRVEFWRGLPEFGSCRALPAFDPAKLKFHIDWRNPSRTTPANGKVVQWQESSAQPWCEDKCGGRWVYELRIDSQDVPLQDDLVIRIDSQDGSRLAEYVGKLGRVNSQQQRSVRIRASQ